MKLSRDPNTGKIYNDPTDDNNPADKVPIVLRGGHYHLFAKDNRPWSGFEDPARPGHLLEPEYTGPPCVKNPPKDWECPAAGQPQPRYRAKPVTWSGATGWDELFMTLANTQCNLLRVWVMGGTGVYPAGGGQAPYDLYPYVAVKVGREWKWNVYGAVGVDEKDADWNEELFFKRLRNFVSKANSKGVCVQLTLLNYNDFSPADDDFYKAWAQSAWNPDATVKPPGDDTNAWGKSHLVHPRDDSEHGRNLAFTGAGPNSGLRDVQKRLVKKLVLSLKGLGNVIFEVMNEPRGEDQKKITLFSSQMVGAIRDAVKNSGDAGWKPLISVNATRSAATQEYYFDTDWWRSHSKPGTPDYVPNFELVDVISYHKITGFDDFAGVQTTCEDRRLVSTPRVDPESMRIRIRKQADAEKNAPGDKPDKKAIMFSTDAALAAGFDHKYCDFDNPGRMITMSVRDGQITTGLELHTDIDPGQSPDEQLKRRKQLCVKSDLTNWAFWAFKVALGGNEGLVHFQNHSGFKSAFQKIFTAWQEANKPAH